MAIENSFKALVKKLDRLLYAVSELVVVLDPGSSGDEPHLVHQLWDQTVPLQAAAEEALAAARSAVAVAGYPLDMDRLRQDLISAQRAYNEVLKIYLFELLFNRGLAELTQPRGRWGDSWRRWGRAVTASIVSCRQPVFEAAEALFQCWQEMVDRIGMNSVSVQTKAIGQEISVPAAELRRVMESVG